ncbi:Card1-like endonuclease domain-containing protein [Shewanella gelidii]|uniref:Card1 endonuclease domain-containing protein n=1 Tax=Shewanella gelidii TaxID=1642821 RepID=A0A917JKM6_9GAMM|nr:DUF1887 family CARF protein [Shewanella gelidii]MCL1097267.1 DUF1887 family CARF protein [Shewanella gelidii]GGI73736.1 hypothetical protein GCM10009332_09110 [Shewanella gelidii]
MAIHIAIMDENPITILTPLLDSKMQAEGLLLIHTHQQQAKVDAFLQLVREYKKTTQVWILPDTLSTDEIMRSLHVMAEQYQGTDFFYNASNGDRHVMLAATNISRSYGYGIFVLEPKRDEVSWLVPSDIAPMPIEDLIRLPTMLRLFDARLISSQRKQSLKPSVRNVGALWASNAQVHAKPLGSLNWLAMNSKQLVTPELSQSMLEDRKLQGFISDLEGLGYLQVIDNRLHFKDAEARFFANGGWLEEYVFSVVDLLRHEFSEIQDLAQGVTVKRRCATGDVENEIDVAFVANNKLHLIECKAKRIEAEDAKAVAYKLDALTDILGGSHARALVVSFRPLSDADVLRTKAQGIEVLAGEQLGQLKHHMRQWLSGC